jgi:glycosyltransferase XagB
VVSESQPQTKPKALNAALPFARGEYLAIYDAEDLPERDQLRKALRAFRGGPPNLACVQARLNIYNASQSFLAAQFAVEYCALFDAMLPALEALRLPIPLGGTSNHFRVSALNWVAAWDAHNVTEDADLGIRLAWAGYRCGTLFSTTYEEAPARLWPWIRQRTRWMKGYLQTWLVHTRNPLALWRELGPGGFIGFQLVIGMTVLSALAHPWFYLLALNDLLAQRLFAAPAGLLGWPLWGLAAFDLAAGYLSAMALAHAAVKARGLRPLLLQIPLMPVYWLLVSCAAYRALWQFATARFRWEKTEHGLGGEDAGLQLHR